MGSVISFITDMVNTKRCYAFKRDVEYERFGTKMNRGFTSSHICSNIQGMARLKSNVKQL